MTRIRSLLPLLLLAVIAAAPSHGQAGPVSSDTIRGPGPSDADIAQALGIPDSRFDVMQALERSTGCGEVPEAILCNVTAKTAGAEDCEHIAIAGHFHVRMNVLRGRRENRTIYVAVVCETVTVNSSSRFRFPTWTFTLNRDRDPEREVVYVQTGTGR